MPQRGSQVLSMSADRPSGGVYMRRATALQNFKHTNLQMIKEQLLRAIEENPQPSRWSKDLQPYFSLPIKSRGDYGEKVVASILGIQKGYQADGNWEGMVVEVKFATLSKESKFSFNQIRVNDAQYLILAYLCPDGTEGIRGIDMDAYISLGSKYKTPQHKVYEQWAPPLQYFLAATSNLL